MTTSFKLTGINDVKRPATTGTNAKVIGLLNALSGASADQCVAIFVDHRGEAMPEKQDAERDMGRVRRALYGHGKNSTIRLAIAPDERSYGYTVSNITDRE